MDKNQLVYIIDGCNNCNLCIANDMSTGYSCRIKEHPDNYIEVSKMFQPITPKWCPLKENDIVFKFDKK